MTAGRPQAVAVVDIGKTNAKVLAVLPDGSADATSSFAHQPVAGGRYRSLDTDAIGLWLKGELAKLAQDYTIGKIAVTAHGATAALIGEDGLAMPVLDYEDNGPDAIEADYRKLRPPFSESFSAPLPGSLNFGRGLYWLSRAWPQDFARAKHILCYAQYWTWLLSGVPALEVSSIGSHSDLWAPRKGDFSSLVAKLGWQGLFPQQRFAADALGPIRAELAAETGLDPDCQVLCGIHDSNASLLVWLDRPAPFTVVSTGTWVILFAVGGQLDAMDPQRDCVANVNIYGKPVPGSRWMGGREYANLREAVGAVKADASSVKQALAIGAMYLPPQGGQGGPYANGPGGSRSMRDAPADVKAAAVELYCALMLDACLELCSDSGDIILEGPFAGNRLTGSILATLRPSQRVLASKDATGTATGVAKLALPNLAAPATEQVLALECGESLNAYRNSWRKNLDG